jgi:hypothetical protein
MDVAIKDTSARKPRRPIESIDAAAPTAIPMQEAIAIRAYELFLERGGQDGGDVEDWLRAERELATRGILESTTRPYES